MMSVIGEVRTNSLTFSTTWLVPFIPSTIGSQQFDHGSIRKLTRLYTKPMKNITPSLLTCVVPRSKFCMEEKTPHLNPTASRLCSSSMSSVIFLVSSGPKPIIPLSITTRLLTITISLACFSSTIVTIVKICLRTSPRSKPVLVTPVIKIRRYTPR